MHLVGNAGLLPRVQFSQPEQGRLELKYARQLTYFLFVMAAADQLSMAGCLQAVQIIHAGFRLLQVRAMCKRHS